MDAFIFLEMVEGHLLWHEQKDDGLLEQIAWFTANQMVISGNMKKGTDASEVREKLFQTNEEFRKAQAVTAEQKQKDVEAEKAKLTERFNL